MTRLDSQITRLHDRLTTELGLTDFSIQPSQIPDAALIISGGSIYRVFPDEVLDALDDLDILDVADSEDFTDEVWATIFKCDID